MSGVALVFVRLAVRINRREVLGICLGGLIAGMLPEHSILSAAPATARQATQTPATDYLATGVARVQAGDFQLGIMMLNEVVAPGSKADAATVARAHAYRAQGFLGLNRPDDARAAALLSLKADTDIAVTAPAYSTAVVELFADLRRPSAAVSPEIVGRAAEQEGRYDEAFAAYVTAYQELPTPAPPEDDARLREKIILLARRLNTPPVVSPQARAHFRKAQELIEAQAVLGSAGTASLSAAASELYSAIRVAPWWAEATLQLATVLQQLQRVEAALANLNLYRLADPEGYAKASGAKAKVETPAARAAAAAEVASVYVYWPPQVRSRGTPKIYCDGFLVAELQKGRFIEIGVAAGAHELKLGSKAEKFSFEPGNSYYVRASQEGFTRWSPFTLQLVDPGEALAELRDKSIGSNDPRRTFTNQCAAAPPRRK